MKIVHLNLYEMDNLMYPWKPLERGVDFASIVFCTTSFSCLLVCLHDISKSTGRIWMIFGGQVWCVTRRNSLDFVEDLDPNLATRIF